MLIIEDVTSIKSKEGGLLVLSTKSGVDIFIEADSCPDYINIESMLGKDENALYINVVIRWDE